ncbi:uncharacterized protein LOC127808034 isoform X2 [Diospyros lotus]|uniref:uncharacterized protein LOC127808034 isoform X2 n=1 Tax=Diospyros lotus TaxID=55363 RepID=UPI0022534B3D|nr:uncharacterized protein LOC127808034 isoform X2 [Diospyros lotus]
MGEENFEDRRGSTEQQADEEEEEVDFENRRGSAKQQPEKEGEGKGELNVFEFLDSVDSYLILLDSLSSILRQGWLDLASARHSMGASRINSALIDLKHHCAATSLQVTQEDVDSTMKKPNFTLFKWVSPDNQKCFSEETEVGKDELLLSKATNPQLRYRGTSEIQEKRPESNGRTLTVDNQIQKERFKLLSMFGALVSPKLRAAQLSFETALDTLVEIANIRSSMLSAYNQVQKEMDRTRD